LSNWIRTGTPWRDHSAGQSADHDLIVAVFEDVDPA